jgi:hypothetical protein
VSAAFSHGLRRGLHSFAAPRLKGLVSVRRPVGNSGIGLVNVPAEKGNFLQGLKPASLLSRSGTAESRALPESIFGGAPENRALPETIFWGVPENRDLSEILP